MTNLVLAFEYMNLSTFPNAGIWMVICLKATSKNSTFRNDRRTFLKLLCALRFFLKSFCFFLNRIARYAQSKELEIFLRKFHKSPAKQFLEIA